MQPAFPFVASTKSNPSIPGLVYLPNYITIEQQRALIAIIDRQNWITDLKRRVQHYGYRYDYRARGLDASSYLGELPDWLRLLADRLFKENVFTASPDQVIVNEYLPGQGIAAHIDCTPCFKDTIASLSLGSACLMDFSHPPTGRSTSLLLEPCSLVMLNDEARYEWTHGIAPRKSDIIDGIKTTRGRRISLTFRQVILD